MTAPIETTTDKVATPRYTLGAAHVIDGTEGGSSAVTTLLTATEAAVGTATAKPGSKATYQASSDASHAGTTNVSIEVSNDNTLWLTLGILSVTGASATDGFTSDASWPYDRANCTAHGDSTNVVTVTRAI